MKRFVRIIGLLAMATVVVVTGCGRKPEEIKIGYIPITLDLPFFVAMEKGYFGGEGLKVSPVKFLTSNPMAEALLSGHIDAITSCSLEVVLAIEQNVPGELRVFMVQANTKTRYIDYILVKIDSPISDMADLKGKKIGTFPGSTILTYTKIILRKLAIDPEKDVTIVQLSPQIQIEALSSGQVDALFTLEPIGTVALKEGVAKPLLKGPLYYIMDPLPGGAYAFSAKFVKKNPKLARKIMRAMYKAVDYIRANETQAKMLLPNWTPVSEDLALEINVIPYWKLEEVDREAVQKLSDLLYREKNLFKKVETTKLYMREQELR